MKTVATSDYIMRLFAMHTPISKIKIRIDFFNEMLAFVEMWLAAGKPF